MDALKFDVTETPHALVVAIAGEVGVLEMDALSRGFKAVIDRAPSLVVLDLSGVSMIA